MKRWSKLIALVVLVFGLINVAIGGTFIGVGVDKQGFLKSAMQEEKITVELTDEQIAAGEVVDTMGEAQKAGDLVREHRHGMAATYNELLGGKYYDPTNADQLSYAQAMNIENYLYLATNSWGVTYLSIGVGAALILAGIALMAIAVVLYLWAKRTQGEKTETKPASVKVKS